jgi:hypothetical protein
MDAFTNAFGVVAALCLGVMIMSVFFTLLGYVSKAVSGYKVVKLKGLLKDGDLVNIHLVGGKTLEHMKFIGFTDGPAVKGNIPFQMRNMVVLESTKGLRLFLRADSVKMIEEIGEDASVTLVKAGIDSSSKDFIGS